MRATTTTALKRLILGCYARVGRGLPADMRSECLRGMLDDLETMLDRESDRSGTWAMGWLGCRALADLGIALVRERWVAARGYSWEPDPRRGIRHTTGETMTTMMRDVRLAARALMQRPGFAAIGTVTLGLGIGATVAIFTLVNAVVLQPLPYPESDRIVEFRHHAPAIDLPNLQNSPGTLNFYQDRVPAFEAIVGMDQGGMNLTGSDRPERVRVFSASPAFFDVFRVAPRIGRAFTAADIDGNGPARVALLTDDGRRALFAGVGDVIGRSVELDGTPVEIIGLLPAGFRPPWNELTHFLLPMFIDPQGAFGDFGVSGFARLAEGATLATAQAQLDELQARLPEAFPDLAAEDMADYGWAVSVRTLKESVVGDTRSTLLIVLGTVGVVLLIACSNVANLFLVRAESRQKELAVRAAMGAGRRRIIGSFLSESLVMGLAGGVLGVGIAHVGVSLLTSLGSQDLPRLHEVAVTPGVLAFAALLAVGAGLFLGMIPALGYSRVASAGILRGNRTSTDGAHRHRARNLLVTAQLAMALVLLVGSGLMVRSLTAMNRLDLGFEPEGVLAVGLSVGSGVPAEEAARFYQRVVEGVSALPRVVSAGYGQAVPLISTGASGGSFTVEGEPEVEGAIPEISFHRAVGPGYMESLGYRLVEGRSMQRSDWEAGVPAVWVSTHFRDVLLDGDAIGQRISWNDRADEPVYGEIVGVYEQTREFTLTSDPMGAALVPMVSDDWVTTDIGSGFLVVRGTPGSAVQNLVPEIRSVIAQLRSDVPITTVKLMDEVVRDSMADRAMTMTLLSIAAAVALFLGMIGLFGVVSYVVGQRTREIGIRMALGAEAGEVRTMVVRQGAAVVATGVLLGLIGAFALTRLLGSLLFEVSATDPLTFVAAPLVLVAVSVLATLAPAHRASRVDPITALRSE